MEQVGLLELETRDAAVVSDRRKIVRGEAHADDLDVVAALLVVADRAPHEAGDAIKIFR